MYKDMLYKKYKRRCIIGLILIILAHTIAISSILVDHFIKHEQFSSDYISFFIGSTIIYIFAASIDYEKFIAIKHNKYSAIIRLGDIARKEGFQTLAKKYYANPEEICEINDLKEDKLPIGQPILITKNMEIFK